MIDVKTGVRAGFATLVVLSTVTVAVGFATSADNSRLREGARVAPPRDHVTVVATDSNAWLGRGRNGPRSKAELFAVGANGTVTYYNSSHTRYWDVDPVPGTSATVQYVAADHLSPAACGGESVCTRNVVERVNLTTGEVTRVFERVTPGKHSTRWHDADRLDATHVVVADIARDRVFAVNTTTGMVTWAWSAQAAYPVTDSGGPYPGDWTHLNDVEVRADGTVVVSLRNHDQVVFVDPGRGRIQNLTLGRDDAHDVLYEQHNPDYIPRDRGGPALLVADSENNRIVEYQRSAGTWKRSWTWTDGALQWPRDADRLPNGNTLVTDSNGDRVVEVNRQGEVVWTLPVAFPYEAERLTTGDESAGGPSATTAGLTNASASEGRASATETGSLGGTIGRIGDGLRRGPGMNALLYVLPVWVGDVELLAILLLAVTSVAWAAVEWRWSDWRLRVRWPALLDRGE